MRGRDVRLFWAQTGLGPVHANASKALTEVVCNQAEQDDVKRPSMAVHTNELVQGFAKETLLSVITLPACTLDSASLLRRCGRP